jgi:hypothetical protein
MAFDDYEDSTFKPVPTDGVGNRGMGRTIEKIW